MSNELGQFNIPNQIHENSRELVQRDERGFIPLLMGGAVLKKLIFSKWTVVGTAGVLLAAGPSHSAWSRHFGAEYSTDLEKAKTSSKSELLVLDKTQELQVASAYYHTEYDASKVEQRVTLKFPLVSPSAATEINTVLEGVGAIDIGLPMSAVTATDGEDGKTDFVVDATKMTAEGHWIDGSPEFHDYTVSDGKKNFDDRAGFRQQSTDLVKALQKFVGVDSISNSLDDLKTDTYHDINIMALDAMRAECPKQIISHVEDGVEDALQANLNMTNMATAKDAKKFGKVIFEGDMAFTVVKPPKEVTTLKSSVKGGTLTASKKFKGAKTDKVSCGSDKAKIEQTPTSVGNQ